MASPDLEDIMNRMLQLIPLHSIPQMISASKPKENDKKTHPTQPKASERQRTRREERSRADNKKKKQNENSADARHPSPPNRKKVKAEADGIEVKDPVSEDVIIPERAEIWLHLSDNKVFYIDLKKNGKDKIILESAQEAKRCVICYDPVKETEKCHRCPQKHDDWMHESCSKRNVREMHINEMSPKDIADNYSQLIEFFPQKNIGNMMDEQVEGWECSLCRQKVFLRPLPNIIRRRPEIETDSFTSSDPSERFSHMMSDYDDDNY